MLVSRSPDCRLRWWWFGYAVPLWMWILVSAPIWLLFMVPLRYAGFPRGVGVIGGMPRTWLGRTYAQVPLVRILAWLVGWYLWLLGAVLTLPPEEVALVGGLPLGIGWWWHLERVYGRRRLTKFLRAPITNLNQPLGSPVTPGRPSPLNLSGPIRVEDMPPLRTTTHTTRPTRTTWPLDDLRRTQPGASARAKAASEQAAGQPDHKIRPWLIGAEGEEIAAQALTGLPAGWTVIHDVPIGTHGANVDHVIIGPAGVFTVNTKHHKDAVVSVEGAKIAVRDRLTDHAYKATDEAARAAALISSALNGDHHPVHPVLLYVGTRHINIKTAPAVVRITTLETIVDTLTNLPPVIPPTVVTHLVEVLARPETWKRDFNRRPPRSPRRTHTRQTPTTRPRPTGSNPRQRTNRWRR